MTTGFKKPDFASQHLEIRCIDNEVTLYATETGLRKIIDLCTKLLLASDSEHVHLDDYELLTAASKSGVIAVFKDK